MNSEVINILFFKDINILLKNKNFDFLCFKKDNDIYEIKDIPLVFKMNDVDLLSCLAYNYDLLPIEIKEKYKFNYKTLNRINDNLYKIGSKIYKMKKNNH